MLLLCQSCESICEKEAVTYVHRTAPGTSSTKRRTRVRIVFADVLIWQRLVAVCLDDANQNAPQSFFFYFPTATNWAWISENYFEILALFLLTSRNGFKKFIEKNILLKYVQGGLNLTV